MASGGALTALTPRWNDRETPDAFTGTFTPLASAAIVHFSPNSYSALEFKVKDPEPMQQVLFRIPFLDIPIYGFGVMLFVAFIVCSLVSGWRARKDGVDPSYVHDMAVWIFLSGIIGARITYMIVNRQSIWQFFEIWKGGLVFYGSFIGGIVGFAVHYCFFLRKHQLSVPKLMDIIAPSVAIGLCLGRLGCLLNGCCFGNVACAHCPAVHFPLSAPPRFAYVAAGYQTAVGFVLRERQNDDPRSVVGLIEAGSPAEQSGLQPNDRIVAVNGLPNDIIAEVNDFQRPEAVRALAEELQLPTASSNQLPGQLRIKFADIEDYQRQIGKVRELALAARLGIITTDRFADMILDWPRGEKYLTLTVARAGHEEPIALPAFMPVTIGLHPTQIYESISTFLIFLLLIAFFPFRRHYGEAMALFMLCYAVHRFLNEMLRNDTDPVFGTGMTLSQNGSILMLIGGLALLMWSRGNPITSPAPQVRLSS